MSHKYCCTELYFICRRVLLKRTESLERTVHNAGILRGGGGEGAEHHSVERKNRVSIIFEMPTLEVTHGNCFSSHFGN